jgi:hypothetical protein
VTNSSRDATCPDRLCGLRKKDTALFAAFLDSSGGYFESNVAASIAK